MGCVCCDRFQVCDATLCPSAMRYAVYQARAEVGLSKTRLAQLVVVVGSRRRRAVYIAVRGVSQK
jgi:hypothetical protein